MIGLPHSYLSSELPGIGGSIKEELEDFIVEEIPLYQPCGEGEHVYFRIEKRDLSRRSVFSPIAWVAILRTLATPG